ncbi:hypothetical protein [Methylorubrum zatmanii]
MVPDEIYDTVVRGFANRKFAAGLCVAYIDFLTALRVPESDVADAEDFFATYPRLEWRSPGKPANQLIVDIGDGKSLGLRPFYNNIEAFFRAKNNRFDYPSCPGHATQAWRDYADWLDAMCGFESKVLAELRERVVKFVLDTLPSQEFDPSTLVKEPPLFGMILEGFDLTKHKGELTGAAFQGVVFGFLRADNPHLQVEIDKVRTGSKRLQRIGDVDAWEGARLAITAEVKQFILKEGAVEQLAGFGNAGTKRGAISLVCALGFEEGVREQLEELGLHPLDLDDMRNVVGLWDPMKQRTAVASLAYYVKHVEKNSALGQRLDAFIAQSIDAFSGPPSADDSD